MNTVTLTQPDFAAISEHLRAHPQQVAVCAAIVNATPKIMEIICGPPHFIPCGELRQFRETSSCHVELGLASSSFAEGGWNTQLLLALKAGLAGQLDGEERILAQVAFDQESKECASGFIAFGKNGQRPYHFQVDEIAHLRRGYFAPIHKLKIVGSGMKQILTVDAFGHTGVTPYETERWSRAMGALGGRDVWKRFVSLHYCVIGVGRTGSLVAHSLSKMGVKQLTLIDPDVVELHNLDAMDGVSEKSVGQYKVEAVKRQLPHEARGTKVMAISRSVMSTEALSQLWSADVLISCVDSNAARLLVGAVACSYAKPLLDIGTGVFRAQGRAERNTRLMGADVRLILPGDGCLFCIGGVRNSEEALLELRNELHGVAAERPAWHAQRAGSLRSLNETAAHLGLGLLESLVTGSLKSSAWLRIEYIANGVPALTRITERTVRHCNFCSSSDSNG
jgi:hypothetical protein